MNTHLVFPDLALRRHPPLWVDDEPERWFAGVDLPPGLYWHPDQYHERTRRNLPVLPGERIELVTVLRKDHSRFSQHIPLQLLRDRPHVLRRVRLTRNYTYQDLYQSPLYRQWLQSARLQPYTLRECAPAVRRRSPVHRLRKAC
ncbi:MAG TPA: hypothetical protein VFV38_16025 [Ktedonobacteraceae bacterium]|nr:hypothetical protein [Ktedonobacteraceae bacterium]